MHVVTVLLTGGQIGFLILWRQATVVHAYLGCPIIFKSATSNSDCANSTDFAKWIFGDFLILLNQYHVKYEFNIH
jgi:hypothetical protein